MCAATVRAPSSATTRTCRKRWSASARKCVLAPGGALLAGAVDIDMLEAKLDAARSANDGDAALSAGAGLPIAVVTYIAGAIEFRADRLDTAMRYFEAIDRLPLDQRQIRVVAAAYMRGRIEQRLGSMELARAAFQATRQHARAGAPDPMGLAVASLGEEARTDLAEARLIEVPWPVTVSDPDEARFTRLVADAVRLYADQAARGSKMALLSLNEVARRLIARDELKFAVADPFVRRLLVVYVVSREHDYAETAGVKDPVVVVVSEAILSQPAPAAGRDLDRLAALAYQGGRYELAERLTVAPNQPLGLWVRAKLALRRGDRAAAVRDWTAALTATENTGDAATLDANSTTRLRGELAVVRLSQGEYRDSLRLLFPVAGTYWGDVAYITERVLTVDELKAFIDGLPAPREVAPSTDDGFWSSSFSPVANLRALLARRLVRDGRVGEALAYFPPPAAGSTSAPGSTSDQPSGDRATVDDARDYRAAVEAARPGWPFDWPWQTVARSEALFKVATLTRQQGMGLMGTEGPPDETVLFGSFPGGWAKPARRAFPSRRARYWDPTRRAVLPPAHRRLIQGSTTGPSPPIVRPPPPTCCHSAPKPMRPRCVGRPVTRSTVRIRPRPTPFIAVMWRTVPIRPGRGISAGPARRRTSRARGRSGRGASQAWVTKIAGSVWRHITLIAVVAIALL